MIHSHQEISKSDGIGDNGGISVSKDVKGENGAISCISGIMMIVDANGNVIICSSANDKIAVIIDDGSKPGGDIGIDLVPKSNNKSIAKGGIMDINKSIDNNTGAALDGIGTSMAKSNKDANSGMDGSPIIGIAMVIIAVIGSSMSNINGSITIGGLKPISNGTSVNSQQTKNAPVGMDDIDVVNHS